MSAPYRGAAVTAGVVAAGVLSVLTAVSSHAAPTPAMTTVHIGRGQLDPVPAAIELQCERDHHQEEKR